MTNDTEPSFTRQRLEELYLAAGLLTRLPLPTLELSAKSGKLPTPADAIWAFPIVGLVAGLLSAAVFWLASQLSLPASLCVIASLATSAILTGLLHEDGLADFADSAGAHGKEDKLRIMRDSAIGTYGTCALIGSFAARAAALIALNPAHAILALIAVHTASRGMIAIQYLMLSPASTTGLASAAGHPPQIRSFSGLAITIAIIFFLLPTAAALTSLIATALSTLAMTMLIKKMIGGYTGDTLGASEQIAQITLLAALTITLISP